MYSNIRVTNAYYQLSYIAALFLCILSNRLVIILFLIYLCHHIVNIIVLFFCWNFLNWDTFPNVRFFLWQLESNSIV